MRDYLWLMSDILAKGAEKSDRTGVGTYSLFGYSLRFDLEKGFPLVTTKRIHIKSIIYELLWFLKGDSNIRFLNEHDVTIWDEWADEFGNLGPIYGVQWRCWNGHDQIAEVITSLKEDPDSRRHIVNAWNVSAIKDMALPPCHLMFQFYVAENKLSCQMYQRSADYFLGVPFNIASYALLTMMMAQACGYGLGDLIINFGDVHLYRNHLKQARLQLTRPPLPLSKMVIKDRGQSMFEFEYGDFKLTGYSHHPAIKAKIAV